MTTTFYGGSGNKYSIPSKEGVLLKTPWDIVLHRAWATSDVGENSLPAIYLTKENGYNWAEIDIRVTSDNYIVVNHDTTFTGVDSNGNSQILTIAESTLEELRALTYKTSSKYGEIKIPLLSEVLEMASCIDLGIVLDITVPNEDTAKKIALEVMQTNMQGKVIYMTSLSYAKAIQSIDKNASFDFVSNIPTDLTPYSELFTGANTVGFDIHATMNTDMTSEIQRVREAGFTISFWGIDRSNYENAFKYFPARATMDSNYIILNDEWLSTKVFP